MQAFVVDFGMVDARFDQTVAPHQPEREPKPHRHADRLFMRLLFM